MLTVKQPAPYGYKSVHDLPTPPSTSRPSPPLIYQDSSHKPLPAIPRSSSPSSQPMSGSHRGLPPPAAMTLGQPAPPGPPPPPPPGPSLAQPGAQYAPPQPPLLGQLPPQPQVQHMGDDTMRSWLAAKAEEEKRRAEEERTRQESLRLEQRRTEYEILKTSLSGGIPPPMVAVVFAGMGGGTLSQAALDWASQQLSPQPLPPSHPPQLLPAAGPPSPEHRRDSQTPAYGGYPGSGGVPSTPGSAQGALGSGYAQPYPGSPTRSRGFSVPGPGARPAAGVSTLPSLNTNVQQGPGGQSMQSHPGIASAQQQQQQEAQPSPSIYFHHWQPPTSQGSSGPSNQPATPSAGEPTKKRKATGPQPAPPAPSSQPRFRSPPPTQPPGSTLSNPPPGRRRGHSRQRSDLAGYRSTAGRGRGEAFSGTPREASPAYLSAPGSARESDEGGSRQPLPASAARGGHSVSSLLSEEPPAPASQHASDMRTNSPGEGTTLGRGSGGAAREGEKD